MVNCPVCDAELDLEEEELDEGDTVTCDECGADLRVAGVDPLDLESLEDEEDEDDDDDDEEDEEEDWK
jgi:alpha-aminoadipate carrier protein LysW